MPNVVTDTLEVASPPPTREELIARAREAAKTIPSFELTSASFELVKTPGYRWKIPLPPEAIPILRYEEEFRPLNAPSAKTWDESLARQVGIGEIECPACKGRSTVASPHEGVITGIKVDLHRLCKCIKFERFFQRWEDPKRVGKDYRNVRLDRLERFAANFRDFVASRRFLPLVTMVNQHKRNCFLLSGPAGYGKTTLLMALYHYALMDWAALSFLKGTSTEAVFIANATTLSAEFRAWEMKDEGRDADEGAPTPLPTIHESRILSAIKAGLTPRIFIEEMDKFKLDSEFQQKMFARIVDAVHSAGGQIVASSNLRDYQLRARLGEQYGGGIIRRIIGPRGNTGVEPIVEADGTVSYPDPDMSLGGWYVDFWESDYTQNKQDTPKAGVSTTKSTKTTTMPRETVCIPDGLMKPISEVKVQSKAKQSTYRIEPPAS